MNYRQQVLFLLHLPPPVHGSSMVGRFIKESKLINTKFNCHYINLLASKNIGESGKVNYRKIKDFLSLWYNLLKSLINERPELCYFAVTATGAAFYRDILLVCLLKLFGIKRVFHMHNKGVSHSAESSVNRFLYSYFFSNSKVILLSQNLYSDIDEFVPENDVHICPNGIPDEWRSFNQTITQAGSQEVNITQILFLSNLIKSKGVYNLLEACAILKDKDISFQCNFIGGEGDISAEEFQAKVNALNIDDKIFYLGKKFGEKKIWHFNHSDIFVLPTYNECFPLVLIEAMQFSLPIITTNEGGITDIVTNGENGFIVPKINPNELAEKLKILISDNNKRIKMGRVGRQKYEREFTLIKFEKRMASILEKIIQEK